MTLGQFVTEFMLRNQDEIDLNKMDAIMTIANSGCAPDVVQRFYASGSPIVRKFVDELVEQVFIASTAR